VDAKVEQLREDIRRLKQELADREAALPAHSVKPSQVIAIEELEDEIQRKQTKWRMRYSASRRNCVQ
jgi:hypothetical protein